MNIAVNQTGLYNSYDRSHTLDVRRIANDSDSKNTANEAGASGILKSSSAYAESLKNSRLKTKATSNEVKKLRYNFKNISSQIMRSKTSTSARQVVSRAKREVLRLKRAKASGQYEEGEIDAALEHAKSMERIAKKKAAHLQQEEMIHITDKPGTNTIAEEFKEHPEELGKSKEESEDQAGVGKDEGYGAEGTNTPLSDNLTEELRAQMEAMQELVQGQMEEMSEEAAMETARKMSDFMTQMSDMMGDLVDQMNAALGEFDLMDELSAVPKEMCEADFKMLVTKHRTDEMKDIAKADKEYLKFLFDKYNKMRAAGSSGCSSSAGSGISMSSSGKSAAFTAGGYTPGRMTISMDTAVPHMDISAPSMGSISMGGFDISV